VALGQPQQVLRVAVGQLFLPVGHLARNRDHIAETMAWAEGEHADVLVLPELALTGYPPEDLLHMPGFVDDNLTALDELAAGSGDVVSLVGFVDSVPGAPGADTTPRNLANAVAILYQGRVRGRYHKHLLPNYGIFDERRYFAPGDRLGGTWAIRSAEVGILICEDLWRPDIVDAQAADGAQAFLVANGSPYHRGKSAQRESTVTDTARRCGAPIVYSNLVGGQDEVVFDGGSLVADAHGRVLARAPQFIEARFAVDVGLPPPTGGPRHSTFVCRPLRERASVPHPPPPLARPADEVEEVYRALVRGLADFVDGNGFSWAVVGLSGGVDSALVAAVAADALGPERVWGLSMPGPQSPPESVTDATELATRLGIRCDVVHVGDAYKLLAELGDRFPGGDAAAAGEGLVPRIRGTLLLALAERHGGVVLPTGNKTEIAVGYGTLYGDMAGGFAVLHDVPKTLVYQLCRWRNRVDDGAFGWTAGGDVIPRSIITKPPSAERTPDRPDREVPAPYEVVDEILERFVELAQSLDEIADAGFDPDVVQRVADLVERNEHVRRQAPPGVKVTSKAFGRDRRLPLTHGYRPIVTPAGEARPATDHAATVEDWLEG
jgi:NAD+ synthase (glutamine-hydrolysing)